MPLYLQTLQIEPKPLDSTLMKRIDGLLEARLNLFASVSTPPFRDVQIVNVKGFVTAYARDITLPKAIEWLSIYYPFRHSLEPSFEDTYQGINILPVDTLDKWLLESNRLEARFENGIIKLLAKTKDNKLIEETTGSCFVDAYNRLSDLLTEEIFAKAKQG